MCKRAELQVHSAESFQRAHCRDYVNVEVVDESKHGQIQGVLPHPGVLDEVPGAIAHVHRDTEAREIRALHEEGHDRPSVILVINLGRRGRVAAGDGTAGPALALRLSHGELDAPEP